MVDLLIYQQAYREQVRFDFLNSLTARKEYLYGVVAGTREKDRRGD